MNDPKSRFTQTKRLARAAVRILLRILPPSPAGRLVDRWPTLLRFLPPGKNLVSRKYLGRCAIRVNTAYGIEYQMLNGVYDPRAQHFIEKYVRPGGVCFDIGANVGAMTLGCALATGPNGQVFAFEPGPYFPRLVHNLRLNPKLADIVVPLRFGLAERTGRLFWTEDATNRGNGSLLPQGEIAVPVTTLDQFFRDQNLSRLDFIKIDVNGAEFEVLLGARETLAAYHPVIYYATNRTCLGSRSAEVYRKTEALLRSLGYSLYKFEPDFTPVKTTAADLDPDSTLALPD